MKLVSVAKLCHMVLNDLAKLVSSSTPQLKRGIGLLASAWFTVRHHQQDKWLAVQLVLVFYVAELLNS